MNFPVIDWWKIGANLLSIGIAYLLALPVAWDREQNARTAGLRTFPLVAVASCGYVLWRRASSSPGTAKAPRASFSAFDSVVTVALGSTLATVLLSKDVAVAEGVSAIALLILLQFVITWLSVRSRFVSRLVKSELALLWHKGEFLGEAMRVARVNESEILAAVRSQGRASMDVVEAVVLETDGGGFNRADR